MRHSIAPIGLVIILLLILGCDSRDGSVRPLETHSRPQSQEELVSIEEGLWGDVWFWTGDFMPPETGRVFPVSREVIVFELATGDDVTSEGAPYGRFVTEVRTTEVGRTQSLSNGFYEISLPPGEYSLFVVEESKLWKACPNWYNFISRVVVEPGAIAEAHIDITHQASY